MGRNVVSSDGLMAWVGRPLSVLAQAGKLGGPSFWLKLRNAREAAAKGDWGRAITAYETLLLIKPASLLTLRGLERVSLRAARAAQQKEHWLEACRIWLKFAEASADTQKAILNIAYCARRLAQAAETPEQMSDAVAAWRCLTKLAPNSKEARNGIEWCLLNLVRFAEQVPDPQAARRYRGELLELSSETDPARWPQAAAELKAKLAAALSRADAARENCAWAEAAKYYRAFLDLDPEAAPIWVQLGHVLKEIGSTREARSAYERAADLDPENADIPLQLGHLFKVTRKKQQAIQAYSRALELDPGLRDAARELGLLGEKDRAEAIIADVTVKGSTRFGRNVQASDSARSKIDWTICNAHLRSAEQHIEAREFGSSSDALTAFVRAVGKPTEQLNPELRERLSSIVERLMIEAGNRQDVVHALARVIVLWLSDRAKRGYIAENFAELFAEIHTAASLRNAPAGSRLARMRDLFFEHDFERHRDGNPESLGSDLNLCGAALGYFRELSRWLPPDSAPLPPWVIEQLTRNVLSLEAGQNLTSLMAYALMAERPPVDFSAPSFADDFGAWYLLSFVPEKHIPSACIGDAIVKYFGAVVWSHEPVGISVTKFLRALWAKSKLYKRTYDLANSLDSLLFSLEIIGIILPDAPQHRIFLRDIISAPEEGRLSLAEECIRVLGSDEMGESFGDDLLAAIRGELKSAKRRFFLERGGPQDVLLIGHAGKATGLGRNFEMLREGLQLPDVALQHLDYDLDGSVFSEKLEAWSRRCRSRPIVVLAVNAQDVPTLFAKDRAGVLLDSHVVGFFLWETSDIPRVQRLGLGLVDEVWTPTQYVADLYAPFVPAHLVGKALSDLRSEARVRNTARVPFTFLMVFDFHSSIERKNPLGAALAFQQAFRAGEDVRLIIKTSNVNPTHWSNALGHWEKLSRVWLADNRIKVINARYSDEQMFQLMQETSCFVSLHRSEGFGYVIADAMLQEIPVIATNYSGNIDFCSAETFFPVSYNLQPVDERVIHWKANKAEWADPDIDSAAAQMRHVFEHYDEALTVARRARQYILTRYSMEAFRSALQNRIATIRAAKPVPPTLWSVPTLADKRPFGLEDKHAP